MPEIIKEDGCLGKKMIIILLAGIILFIMGLKYILICENDKTTKMFTSEDAHISLMYEKEWTPPLVKKNETYATLGRFEGENGFFEISYAAGHGLTIDEFIKTYYDKGSYFVMKPEVSKLKIDHQIGRLILPSGDETSENREKAVLVAKYPENIHISGVEHLFGTTDKFDLFILYADKDHIRKIVKTLKFVK